MLNFRLADSMPRELRAEWESLLQIKDERERRLRLEEYLDSGHGACELAMPIVAQEMEAILLRDDNRRCRLLAWVIMPNHVHVLVEIWNTPVGKLVQSWKKLSTNFVNKLLGRTGSWWQEDYFDRYMRDETHFHKTVHYIEWNPVKAGLVKEPKLWPWGSAKWRPDGHGLQPIQRPDVPNP